MLLVDGTGKAAWDQGSISLYTSVFANYRDVNLLAKACVAALQQEYFGKPSLPAVKEQYDMLLRLNELAQVEESQQAERRQLTTGRLPTYEQGVEIAVREYRLYKEARNEPVDEAYVAALTGDGRDERRLAAKLDRNRR